MYRGPSKRLGHAEATVLMQPTEGARLTFTPPPGPPGASLLLRRQHMVESGTS
jgi:hypothetical protein